MMILFCCELTSLNLYVVYASQNAGCHTFLRQKNPYHRLPEILRWYACGAEGGSGGRTEGPVGVRSRDCQNFLGWVVLPHFLIHGAPL